MRTNINRITSLLLALVMTLSLAVTAFAADNSDIPEDAVYVTNDNGDIVGYYDAETGEFIDVFVDEDLALVTKFSDVKSTAWYYNDVTECAKLGIVAGFEDGTFKPEDPVSRVQFITMLTRTFYADKLDTAQKSKPAGSPWYWANKKVADDVGMTRTLVEVNDNKMNRYEMSMAIKNTCVNQGKSVTAEQKNAAKAAIKDWNKIPTSPYRYDLSVQCCYALGIITGMTDGTFSGTQSMTRAQACTVIMRMLKLINNYNPGDKDNDQYDDGKDQNQNQNSNTLANGKPITEANVLAILDEIQREYPTKTVWGVAGTSGNHYYADGGKPKTDMADLNVKFRSASVNGAGLSSLNYGCGGWACMVSERIFGQTGFPFREVTNAKDVRAGDIIIHTNNKGQLTHYSVATSNAVQRQNPATGQTIWQFSICGGNVIGADNIGRVKWNTSAASSLSSNIRCFTRYPA